MVDIKKSEVINGVIVAKPQIFEDDRGFFIETWRQEWLPETRPMIQSNRADRSIRPGGRPLARGPAIA